MEYAEYILTIPSHDLTVSCIDEGPQEAQTVILIHGFPLNKTMWNAQITALKEDFRVVAYDIRGHGNSHSSDVGFSMGLFANDLIALMDTLKIDKAVVCGFSMGGYIALNAIEKYPERFNALLLCDTNCAADSAATKKNRMKAIESIKENGLAEYADESIKKLFALSSISKKSEEVAFVREMIIKTEKSSIYKSLHALADRKDTCNVLTKIRMPVLIMVGEEDEITPPDVAFSMQYKIIGAELHLIEHAGHMSNIENSAAFNKQLIKFAKSIKM